MQPTALSSSDDGPTAGLPPAVRRVLQDVVAAAVPALKDDLVCIALFGSGAENRLRPTSDVNLIFVLKAFDPEAVHRLSDDLRTAEAAIRLEVMFVLETELADASEAFASKFADIRRRHVVLHGKDVLAGLVVPRAAAIFRNRQILLNLVIRLRHDIVLRGLQDERMVRIVADAAAPLRSAAAALAELQGQAVESPRTALADFVAAHAVPAWTQALDLVTQARMTESLAAGQAEETALHLLAIAQRLSTAFERLDASG